MSELDGCLHDEQASPVNGHARLLRFEVGAGFQGGRTAVTGTRLGTGWLLGRGHYVMATTGRLEPGAFRGRSAPGSRRSGATGARAWGRPGTPAVLRP